MVQHRIVSPRDHLRYAIRFLGGPTAAARRLGVSRSVVTYWNNGQRIPSATMVDRITAVVPGIVPEALR